MTTSRVTNKEAIQVDSMDVDDNNDDEDVVMMVQHPSSQDPEKENHPKLSTTSQGYQIPFVEKYRPRSLDDVLGNKETVLRLRAIAKDGNLPNLILCGPPGTGTYTPQE
jgi:hypothetical protein